jgi:O-acetyl-ADP-ribose deacetylase (regulator of RNase III)
MIILLEGDITEDTNADAIVNAANPSGLPPLSRTL